MSCIKYVGVDDADIRLFESQYVVEEGMCYNSYLIDDEKIAIMDAVDARKTDLWLQNVKNALAGRQPDYVVVQHMEPDHSGSLAALLKEYPEIIVVASAKALQYIPQFFENIEFKSQTVGEGDILCLGKNTLQFITAPMVHWPEVIVSYMASEKVLFSADGFGKFGVYNADPDDWACEARRYYFNICGKYGVQVSALLKKAAGIAIEKICPLHGPVLEGEKMAEALRLYSIWAKYDVETPGGVLVAYASIHGNTKKAAEQMAEILKAKGAAKVAVSDLSRDDEAETIEDAFRYGKMIIAAPTYDGGLFPPMESFLSHLKSKNFQKRKVGIVENGTWTPMSGKLMKATLETMKEIEICPTIVTLKSSLKKENISQLELLAEELLK